MTFKKGKMVLVSCIKGHMRYYNYFLQLLVKYGLLNPDNKYKYILSTPNNDATSTKLQSELQKVTNIFLISS